MKRLAWALAALAVIGTGMAQARESIMDSAPESAPDSPRAFVRGSQQAIVSSLLGQPFVLALWSLDCVYCRHDLAMFGRLKADHPGLTLVLVATDPPERRGEIAPVLGQLQLGTEQSWVFADSFVERLRYEVDPEWLGELPRTYFYAPDGSRTAVSGKLDEAEVERWLRAAGAAGP